MSYAVAALGAGLVLLIIAWSMARRRAARAGARANRAEASLKFEALVSRRVLFGHTYRGDIDAPAGCPICGAGVAMSRVAFILVQSPSRPLGNNVTVHAGSRATAHVMHFDPCGCVWDSQARASGAPNGFDLVCLVDAESGRTRFALQTREVDDQGPRIITKVEGALGECPETP